MAFHQEGADDEDMTPIHMTMFGAWYGGVGGQQGCPSQEGGPRLIQFESRGAGPKQLKFESASDSRNSLP